MSICANAMSRVARQTGPAGETLVNLVVSGGLVFLASVLLSVFAAA